MYLNKYLNDKVVETHPQNPAAAGRVQIDHVHRRELDSFYELPAHLLGSIPAAVRSRTHQRRAPKVRVTTDQKTNEVLATIIKVPVDNIHIHMPRSKLDCRVSVNFEMKYTGDISELSVPGDEADMPERGKDRLSYRQGCYQIDLTQVTKGGGHSTGAKVRFKHGSHTAD